MSEEENTLISKHSSGVSILIRIDILWKDANNHSRTGRFNDWNNDLDAVWRELARDFDDTEYKKKQKKFDEFDKDLARTGQFLDNGVDTFDGMEAKDQENRSKQYKILNRKELFLKRVENSLGKGTTWNDGDEDDFE